MPLYDILVEAVINAEDEESESSSSSASTIDYGVDFVDDSGGEDDNV